MGGEKEQSPKKAPKSSDLPCVVRTLEGETLSVPVPKNATGQALFDKVVAALNLVEKDYFGISWRDESHFRNWLYKEKKISSQLKGQPLEFYFEVKFYPTEPSILQEDLTRYELCLQVQSDVASGRLPCSFVTLAVLGSYMAQAQLGDFKDDAASETYDGFRFAPAHTPELIAKVAQLHRTHKGQMPSEAEGHYLDNAKKLAMYGVDLHPAHDSDKVPIQLGVCANGLNVYRDRLRVNRFAWPKILKISYRRSGFNIKMKPGEFEQYETTVGFRLESQRAAKRLWKACVEHHTFYRLMQPEDTKAKGTLSRFGSSRFRYSGRTQFQSRMASQMIDRPAPTISRSHSGRMAASRSMDPVGVATRHSESSTMPRGPVPAAPPNISFADGDRSSPIHRELYQLPEGAAGTPSKEYYKIAGEKSPSEPPSSARKEKKAKKKKVKKERRDGSSDSSSSSSSSTSSSQGSHEGKRAVRTAVLLDGSAQDERAKKKAAAALEKERKKREKEEAKARKRAEKEAKKGAHAPKEGDPGFVVHRQRSDSSSSSHASGAEKTKDKKKAKKGKKAKSKDKAAKAASPPAHNGAHDVVVESRRVEELPVEEDVITEVDEHGQIVTRTIKKQMVRTTVQREAFHTQAVEFPEESVSATRVLGPPDGAVVSGGEVPMVETHTRTLTYAAGEGAEGGDFLSSHTVSSDNRTVESITYKTEKDGKVETHVEHRVTIHSNDDLDHDAELSAAIMEATKMNPNMTVEKIEVKQESQC